MKIDDTIYIIGGGAIGKSLAVFLKLNNKKVVIIRGSVDDGSNSTENIEVEINKSKTVAADIEISTLTNYTALNGIIVLTNKSFGNEKLAMALSSKCKNAPIVILQNGLNVEQPFLDNGFSQIYRVVIFASSQELTKNKFRFKPVEPSPIGIIKGNAYTQEMIVKAISSVYFEFISVENILPLVWTKTIANCVFNSVCPLLETDNGIFYRNKSALKIAHDVIAECVAVAQHAGLSIEVEKVLDKLLQISRSGDGQLISTYQDIINKRETEIESFNFAIATIAKDLNVRQPVVQTSLLGELVKLKSEISRGN
ncbi:MAG: ketopantoate reductase C-terminal domain-containing protein [Ferruginibacter sp.]